MVQPPGRRAATDSPEAMMAPAPRDVRWKLHLASPRTRVWELLSTDSGRERFWCESSTQEGSRIEMHFTNGWVERADVLTSDAPRLLTIRYFGTPVTFALSDDGAGGTDLELLHNGVPPEAYEAVLPGWLNVLFPLKAVADFDVDLRNHDGDRTWDDGYVDG